MVATALGLGESSGSHASSVQHVEMVGSASVIDEQSPGAEHAAWEHGELGTSGQAVSSQHATADEQTSALADDEAAPHVGSVHALEMWWMSEQGEDDADEVQSRQSVAQDTGTEWSASQQMTVWQGWAVVTCCRACVSGWDGGDLDDAFLGVGGPMISVLFGGDDCT